MAKCVLIVDDDPAQRRILEETVKKFGYETKTAESGEDALDLLKSDEAANIALVLLDLVMPGLDGMGVLERLRPDSATPPVIVQTALDREKPCELCEATLDAFVSILGGEAGNLALKVLATGGVYLGGGIPPRILPALERPLFLQAFQRKGRFADLLARVPVKVILNPKSALLGAACHGLGL